MPSFVRTKIEVKITATVGRVNKINVNETENNLWALADMEFIKSVQFGVSQVSTASE